MNTLNSTVIGQVASVPFLPHLWLLTGKRWGDLPTALQTHPWAAWRKRAGLVFECEPPSLHDKVQTLLDGNPDRHLHILAQDISKGTWTSIIGCAPDERRAQRVSIGLGNATENGACFDGLDSILEPEPAANMWLNAQGKEFIPQPEGITTEELLNEWESLMKSWIQRCKNDIVGDAGLASQPLTGDDLTYALMLYGPPLDAEVGSSSNLTEKYPDEAANRGPMIVAAAAAPRKTTRWGPIVYGFSINAIDLALTISVAPGDKLADRSGGGGAGSAAKEVVVQLFETDNRERAKWEPLKLHDWVGQIALQDGYVLPLVLRPALNWQLELSDGTELQERVAEWWENAPEITIWIRKPSETRKK